jgi:hypothetical protein
MIIALSGTNHFNIKRREKGREQGSGDTKRERGR